jgi:hypothetical protein
MKTKLFTKLIVSVLLITTLLAALPTSQALAAEDAPEGLNTRLENLLMREKVALNNQADRLARTPEVVAKTEAFIQKMKDKGLDTSNLEKALASYEKGVQAAQEYHDQAAAILANPAGFDANGKVVDRKQAAETVRTAGNALRRAHLEITEASMDLRAAVREFIEENKPPKDQP